MQSCPPATEICVECPSSTLDPTIGVSTAVGTHIIFYLVRGISEEAQLKNGAPATFKELKRFTLHDGERHQSG
jgi:hypothetical protein